MSVNMEERAGHTGSEKWVTELVCCYLCYEIYCFNAVDRAIQCLNNWGQLKTVFEFTCSCCHFRKYYPPWPTHSSASSVTE